MISPQTHAPAAAAPEDTRGVTWRAVVLSLALAVFFGYAIPIIDYLARNTYLGGAHLPPGAVGALLLLVVAINPLLRVLGRRFALTRNELLTIYISALFSALVPGHGGENYFVSSLVGSFYYASPENKWLEFLRELPPWFSPALGSGGINEAVARGWYEGGPIPWGAWLLPLAAWSALIFALYAMLACLGVLLRAQWAQNEALSFPLLKLPLEMTENPDGKTIPPFFGNRMMWIGFGLAAFVQLVNGLHRYFPDVPVIPLSLNTTQLLTEAPWNQIGRVDIRVLPIVVGVSFLLASEVSLSLWAFYWLMKFQLVAAYAIGYPPDSLPGAFGLAGKTAFLAYERLGALFAYVLIVMWIGRGHFGHIAARATGRARPKPGESEEALSYPVAFWGFVLSLGFLLGWSILAGISPLVAVALWGTYLVMALALTRLVVEGGLIFVQPGMLPLNVLGQLGGSGAGTWMTASSIVPGSFLQFGLMTDMRGFLLPSFVHSFKMARDRRIAAKPLLALISACVAISFVLGVWMNVRLGYEDGGLSLESWFGSGGKDVVAGSAAKLLRGAPDQSWLNWAWTGIGGALTWALMAARARFTWFPLHPVGLLLAVHYPIDVQQFSIFLGWLAKTLITKFGGHDVYRAVVPAALGLILGDVAMMLFWLLISWWQGTQNFQLMPT